MPTIDPHALVDALHFEIEDGRIGVNLFADAVWLDQRGEIADVVTVHGSKGRRARDVEDVRMIAPLAVLRRWPLPRASSASFYAAACAWPQARSAQPLLSRVLACPPHRPVPHLACGSTKPKRKTDDA